jgi:integrase
MGKTSTQTFKLTAASVEKLKPTEPEIGADGQPTGRWRQRDQWDAQVRLFGVRISGTPEAPIRSYFVMPRVLAGVENGKPKWKPQRVTLGRVGEIPLERAREEAREKIRQAREGQDPAKLKREALLAKATQLDRSFAKIRDRFLSEYVDARGALNTVRREGGMRARSAREYRLALCSPHFQKWTAKPVAEITKDDVRDTIEAVGRQHPTQARRLFTYLRKFFSWAVARDLIAQSPCDHAQPEIAGGKAKRERTLSDSEIACLWAAVDGEPGTSVDPLALPLIKLLVMLGQRLTETSRMCWAHLHDLDGTNPHWILPGSETKNGRTHLVPLPAAAVAILKAIETPRDGFVFLSPRGNALAIDANERKWLVNRSREIAGERGLVNCFTDPFTPHDLRRTLATNMARLGVEPHVTKECINHLTGGAKDGVEAHYNLHTYELEKRDAFERWASKLAMLTGGTDGN